jgi:CBS domain-containing protein
MINLLKRKISEIIKPNILVTESNVRLGDLCDLLAEKNIGGVPVVDDEQLVGIVTERDILNVILKD